MNINNSDCHHQNQYPKRRAVIEQCSAPNFSRNLRYSMDAGMKSARIPTAMQLDDVDAHARCDSILFDGWSDLILEALVFHRHNKDLHQFFFS